MARPKRKDKTRTVLRTGELQRSDGSYQYSWTDENHKRRYVYSKTLEALRIKEEAIEKDKSDGIKAEARYVTLDDLYELWKDLKRGLKNNTFENYKYIYETFVRRQIGSKRVSTFLKSDIKRFYNYLVDERGLKPATVDGVHNILHQIFDMAVDDNYIRNNPTNNVLRELKKAHCFKTEKRRGLTRPEQELFMDYLKNSNTAVYWYPVFAVMLGTGLRVGEVTGLRWCDIDLEDGIIDVNHTLVYYDHRTSEGKKGCYFNVNTPKTEAGNRQVPMLDFVKEAYSQCVFIEDDGTDYKPTKTFMQMLLNDKFYEMLQEPVEFGIRRYERNYKNTYKQTDLVLYQKYTYEDVCRLLNWEQNEVPLNIGGYKFDKKTKTFPVFINYDKSENISDTTKYEDHFIPGSRDRLIAISKSGRTLKSEDVQNFLKAKERGIQVELFVRKNKDDKISKEFYYLGHMTASGNTKEFTMVNTEKTAVEIEWILDVPVREDIYEYIVNS